jgi:NitT/TauT family transport system permease protein
MRRIPSWRAVWGLRATGLILLLWLWEWAGRQPGAYGIPAASATAAAFWHLLASGALTAAVGTSARSFVLGFGPAVLVGIPVGLLMALVQPLGRMARVYLDVAMAVPMAAVVPLVILTLGINVAAVALVVFVFSMPFVASNTYGGVREVSPRLIEMALAFDARRSHILFKILLPGATPMILAGIRYGLARAFVGLVVAELLLAPFGLGQLIADARSTFDFDRMFASVLALLLAAVVVISGVQRLEGRLLHWRQ